MKNIVDSVWKDEPAEDLTEQALLLVLIALASVTAMKGLATAIRGVYNPAPSDPVITS